MSLKSKLGSVTHQLDREAVLNYQAGYLARRFAIPLSEARAFIDRFGLDRKALNEAVQKELVLVRPS